MVEMIMVGFGLVVVRRWICFVVLVELEVCY